MNIRNRTPLSDGQKKEIYRDVWFFHEALQLLSLQNQQQMLHSDGWNICSSVVRLFLLHLQCTSYSFSQVLLNGMITATQ